MWELGIPWEMTPPFLTETEVLAANCTRHMLSKIWESAWQLQQRRADLGGEGHQERATRYSICTLSARAVTTGPDVPKATTRQYFFSGLCLSLPRASGSSYLQHPGGLPGFCLLASVWVLATSNTALQSSACLVGFVLFNHLLEEELFDGRLTLSQNTIR